MKSKDFDNMKHKNCLFLGTDIEMYYHTFCQAIHILHISAWSGSVNG